MRKKNMQSTVKTQSTPRLGAPAWLELSRRVVRHLPRGRYRAMNLISKRLVGPFITTIPESALLFECDLRNGLAREVFFTGGYEPQETAIVRALLRPGDVFCDVGAHWGYFSLLAARLVGRTGRIVSIEADPRIYRTLARNIALNAMDGIAPVACAISDAPGTLEFEGYAESSENWGVSRAVGENNSASHDAFSVPARPLDDVLDDLDIERVRLLKMDIEGAEALAVRGMKRGIERGRYEHVLLELHPRELKAHRSTADDVVRAFTEAGYSAHVIAHDPETTHRFAYEPPSSLGELLGPLGRGGIEDAWPHVLLSAKGAEDPTRLEVP